MFKTFKTSIITGIVALAIGGAGGAFLHAQTAAAPAYLIAHVQVSDQDGWKQYLAALPGTLAPYHVKTLARATAVALDSSTPPEGGTIIDPGIAPHDGEVVEQKPGGPDKFLGSDLDARLKASGIKTVIITGTSAQGVGIGTGSASAQRGYNVIYPVDGVASESAFRELYAAWHMGVGGPPVTTKWVTVTRIDMIKF